MKNIVKIVVLSVFVFSLALIIQNVSAANITKLEVDTDGELISIYGTTEKEVSAVSIGLYNETGTELINLRTVSVYDDNEYYCDIEVKEGKYMVKVADYEGGKYSIKENVVVTKDVVIEKVNLTLSLPVIGDTVTSTAVDDGYMGEYEQDNNPRVKVEENANYEADFTMWIKGTYAELGDGFDEPITTTFEKDKYYYAAINITTGKGYVIDENTEFKVNGEKVAEVLDVNGRYGTVIAKVKAISEEEKNTEVYTIKNGTFEIQFLDEDGQTFKLFINDYWNLTDEELKEIGISREDYDSVVETVKKNLNKYDKVLNLYEIRVVNYDYYELKTKGTFKFKIKMTDEMKNYNEFKLVCLDDDTMAVKENVSLKEEDGYLVGDLPHLSIYALVGNNVEVAENTSNTGIETTTDTTIDITSSSADNVKTGDTVYIYVAVLALALVAFVTFLTIRKRASSKK